MWSRVLTPLFQKLPRAPFHVSAAQRDRREAELGGRWKNGEEVTLPTGLRQF